GRHFSRTTCGSAEGDCGVGEAYFWRRPAQRAEKSLPEAKKVLKQFPTIGNPSADKILLFTKTAPVAAIPSNCVHVLPRLGFGEEKKNYAASYRSVQEATRAQLPERVGALLRAYL